MTMTEYDYIKQGEAIYRQSFAIIRAEADLSRFSADEAELAVRMIHAAGMVEAAANFEFGPGFVTAARMALEAGAPIFCDAEMVARGVTAARLPAANEVICTLHVSGCAKGCAHPGPATATLTGRDGRFDLIPDGPAGGTPLARGLTEAQLTDRLRGPLAPRP